MGGLSLANVVDDVVFRPQGSPGRIERGRFPPTPLFLFCFRVVGWLGFSDRAASEYSLSQLSCEVRSWGIMFMKLNIKEEKTIRKQEVTGSGRGWLQRGGDESEGWNRVKCRVIVLYYQIGGGGDWRGSMGWVDWLFWFRETEDDGGECVYAQQAGGLSRAPRKQKVLSLWHFLVYAVGGITVETSIVGKYL